MTAIEPQQDGTNPRKKLYSALVGNANPEAKSHFKKFSFEQFNKRLDDEKFVEDLYQSLRDNDVVLDPKNRQPEQNYYDFIDAYVKVPTAKPAAPVAKPAAAPVAAAPIEQAAPIPSVEPMEEEEIPEVEYEGQMLPEVTATPAPYQFPERGTLAWDLVYNSNPEMGTPEYDYRIAMLNQPPKLVLGGGGYTQEMAAGLPETKEKAKQYSLSPVFKDYEVAQKMMKGEVPLVTQKDVREAKENWNKMTKEQQQAAIMGGPGYEYEQERKAEERGGGETTRDIGATLGALTKSIGQNMANATLKVIQNFSNIGVTPMGEDEPEAFYYKRERANRNQQMYENAKAADEAFQNEIAKRNIQTSVYDAIQKGKWDRVPEATAYTIGEAAIQMLAFMATRGASAYLQTLPQEYKRGVEAIAKETNRTPEQVIADGDDAELTAMASSGIQYGLERFGMSQISKGMRSKGGYKAVRDWLIKNTKSKPLARAGGVAYIASAESLTEGSQAAISQAAELSTSNKPFMDKVDKFFTDPNFIKERKQAETAGAIGGGFLGGAGRAVTKAFEKGPNITQFSPEVQGNEIIQEAARGYQDNIAKAEEQGRKPDAYNKRELNKLATDPEAWVKGEIKYLTQTIQDNKKNNIDSKVEETKLARANALLAQIKAEKKGMEQAALAPAQEAAPVAPEAPVAPAETVTAPEVTAPVAFPSDEQIADDIQNRRYAKFTYSNESEVPEQFRDKISSRGETNGVPFVRVTLPQSVAEYEASRATLEAPATETAPVTEEAPVAEETIPVAPETEEDYSFLEETELTPEEEAALLAQEEAAPVAPAEEEVVTEEAPAEPVTETPKVGSVIGGDVETKNEGKADTPTKESVTERLNINNPFYKKVEDALVKLGLIEKYNPETGTGDVVGGYVQPTSDGGFSAGKMYFSPDGSISYISSEGTVQFDKNGNVISENTKETKQKAAKLEIEGKKESIANLEKTRDSEEFKYKEVTETDPLGNRKKVRRLKTEQELKESTDKINAAIDKAKTELSNLEQSLKAPEAPAASAPKAKKAPAPKAETKQETPKTETKKEEAPKTEAKPVSTTPQEGATVEIPAQRAEFGTRKMVFKEGEWKQNVGGDILKVGPAVQQQAQEAFAGKEETKPAETKTEVAPKEEGKKAEAKEEKPAAVVSEKDVVSTKIKEIAEKFKSIESELQGEIDVQDFSDRLRKRYEEIKNQYGEAKANEVLKSESNRADKIIKESRDGILKRLKGEYFKKNGFAPSSIKDFQKGIDSGEYKINDLPSYKDAVNAKIVEEVQPSAPSSTTSLASQVEDMRSLPPAKRKAAQQALEERYGKEDVEKMIEITANFTKIIDDLEKRGVVKIDCP